mmetsp:Transcript_148586/g.274204  ORF Transcript_148586/g.274204 Transcript_148586/m.274204 type:complete len:208 (-) Transcript_148586:810-1433(-)
MIAAPTGAVHRMASTAIARMSRPISFSFSVFASSRATAPMAACTVAFGIQANAVKRRSCMRSPLQPTAKNVTMQRTVMLQASMSKPKPTIRASSSLTETAAPTSPKSRGCAKLFQASPSCVATGFAFGVPQPCAAAAARTSTAKAEAPENPPFLRPKKATTAMTNRSATRALPPFSLLTCLGMSMTRQKPPKRPAAKPITNSSGARA